VPVEVRLLSDDDRDAVLEHLRPTETRSTLLIGDAMDPGITDTGGHLNGAWFGAFEGGRLAGLLAWIRGPSSVLPACGEHAKPLVDAVVAKGIRPAMVLGTTERVDAVLAAAPSRWRVARTNRETLMVLRWADARPPKPPDVPARIAPPPLDRVDDVAELLDVLTASSEIPRSHEQNVERARRMTRSGTTFGAVVDGRVVAISCEAAASARWVHVGATATLPTHRRQGLSGACVQAVACVAAVLENARRRGLGSEGAVLFTGEENAPAIALYERMGFVRDAAFSIAIVEHAS
jgi:GNAT superfamily N-acetyltransferase